MSNLHGRALASLLTAVVGVIAPLPAGEPEASAPTDLVGPLVILESQKAPVFPPAARAGRFNGSVMVEATVLKDGTVGEVKVLDCTRPRVGFEEASIAAVKAWRFEPGTRGGEPVEFNLKVRLNFSGGPDGTPRVSAGSFVSATKDSTDAVSTSARDSEPSPGKSNPPR